MRDITVTLSQHLVLPQSACRNSFATQSTLVINTFGIEGEIASSQVPCTESLRVMVWYKQALWCCSGFDMPQVI